MFFCSWFNYIKNIFRYWKWPSLISNIKHYLEGMYPHVIKRWNLSWCNTQNAGIVKHGVMGDKRKIRTPKVRESFFKPMNILGLNGNSINALTYSTITHFQETKFNLKRYQFKNLTSTIPWTNWFQNKNKNREFTISYFFH